MSHECEYCKRELNKDDDFILIGKYPGRWKRYVDSKIDREFLGLSHLGQLYHKKCYHDKMKED